MDDRFTTKICIKSDEYSDLSNKYKEIRAYKSNKIDIIVLRRLISESIYLMEGNDVYFMFISSYHEKNVGLFIQCLNEIKTVLELIMNIDVNIRKYETKEEKEEQRLKYRRLVQMLNEAKEKGHIDAKEWREINKKWRNDEFKRDEIEDNLLKMLKK